MKAGTGPEADEVFRTARLAARRWRDSDLEPLLRVYGDPVSMRWVGDGTPLTGAEAERWFDVTSENYARRGYGMFALEDRGSCEVVGFIGIVHPGGQSEPEVKYAFAKEHWGKGFATEAVRGTVQYGATLHGLTRIIATTAPENAASHRVLEKSDFARSGIRRNDDGTDTWVFAWTAS